MFGYLGVSGLVNGEIGFVHAGGFIVMGVLFVVALVYINAEERRPRNEEDNITDRIKSLSITINESAHNLDTSVHNLNELEDELKERLKFVEELNEKAKQLEKAASLNEEHMKMITQILNITLLPTNG